MGVKNKAPEPVCLNDFSCSVLCFIRHQPLSAIVTLKHSIWIISCFGSWNPYFLLKPWIPHQACYFLSKTEMGGQHTIFWQTLKRRSTVLSINIAYLLGRIWDMLCTNDFIFSCKRSLPLCSVSDRRFAQ